MMTNYLANVPKLKGREIYGGLRNVHRWNGEKIAQAQAKLILIMDSSLFIHIKNSTMTEELWICQKN